MRDEARLDKAAAVAAPAKPPPTMSTRVFTRIFYPLVRLGTMRKMEDLFGVDLVGADLLKAIRGRGCASTGVLAPDCHCS